MAPHRSVRAELPHRTPISGITHRKAVQDKDVLNAGVEHTDLPGGQSDPMFAYFVGSFALKPEVMRDTSQSEIRSDDKGLWAPHSRESSLARQCAATFRQRAPVCASAASFPSGWRQGLLACAFLSAGGRLETSRLHLCRTKREP